MEIKNNPRPNPIASNHMAGVYMRWALQASKEVPGKQELIAVLRENGLGQ